MKKKIITSLFFASLIFVISGCGQGNISDQNKTEKKGAAGKTVDYNDFWKKLNEEGAKWAGGEYYLIEASNRAVTSNILRVDSIGGQATAWKGSLVKCNELKDPGGFEEDQSAKICKGNKMIYTLYIDENGNQKSTTEEDKFAFYGTEYFNSDSVKVTAIEAEAKANNSKSFKPGGFENYNFELKKDKKSGMPVWSVAMSCPVQAEVAKKCAESDHWGVKINAQTGEVIN